jgi:hypothetical protein
MSGGVRISELLKRTVLISQPVSMSDLKLKDESSLYRLCFTFRLDVALQI